MFQHHREDSPYWDGLIEGAAITLSLVLAVLIIHHLFL